MATVEIHDGWEAPLLQALEGAVLEGHPVRVRLSSGVTPEDHFGRLAELLELEAQA